MRKIIYLFLAIFLLIGLIIPFNIYSNKLGDDKIVFESDRKGEHGLYRVDKYGTNFLLEGGCPQVASDGTKIAFIDYKFDNQRREYKMRLAIFNQKSKKVGFINTKELTLALYPCPKFSPDMKCIAFIASDSEGGENNIYLINVDNGSIEQISNYRSGDKSFIQSFDWFSAGDYIAYKNRGEGLVRLNINNKDKDLLIDSTQFSLGEFSIAKNNKYIVFSGNGKIKNKTAQYRQTELFLFDLVTREAIKLTNNQYDERYPALNSTGEKVCYTSFRHHSPLAGGEVYIMDIKSRQEYRITKAKKKGTMSPFGGLTNDIYPSWVE
jgi:Tol biopolymer transport system component